MKTDHWMPLYIGDYLADTSRFTTEQHGAYLLILMDYWRNGPPPDDENVLASIAKLPVAQWRRIEPLLRAKFTAGEGGVWIQKRVEAERQKASGISGKRSEAGKAGAAARYGKAAANAIANATADASQTHAQPQPQQQEPRHPAGAPALIANPDGLAPARPSVDRPQLALVDGQEPARKGPPDCPHLDLLALWGEVLPAMPQHLVSQWRGTRADQLRARWRETAVEKGWQTQADGLAYFRKLFAWIGRSPFLTGRVPGRDGRPFSIELAWLVNPTNWAKVLEGKFHEGVA